MKIEKILTDNPYVDELVYYVKVLSTGAVLKNQQKALDNETLESMKDSDLYIACIEKYVLFEQLDFSYDVLLSCGVIPEYINDCMFDRNNIPKDKRDKAIQLQREEIIKNYKEKNNYYRSLMGLPNYNSPGMKIDEFKKLLPSEELVDTNKYIHEMNQKEIEILNKYDILYKMIEKYPNEEYLKFIGKGIEPYKARKASRFEVIYLPKIDSIEVFDKFKSRLDLSRMYTLKTIYSEAFKIGSDYYDSFIAILIVMQTAIDVISDIQEFIARKDIFDLRSIRYIFKSFGIPFYPEIPMKYQVAMMKNINKLIKFGSTRKNMVDICSLFGFDNIEIFKYYILKERKKGPDEKYLFDKKEIPDPNDPEKTIMVEDMERNFNLKFVRLPLEGEVDNSIKDPTNYLNYDDVTISDPSWDGELPHEYVKKQILEREFNYERTKYISIDSVYEVTDMSFQLPYFVNMLFDDVKLEEELKLDIPYLRLGIPFKLTDIFCFLFSLTYEFNNVEDNIMDTTGKVLHVMGFNFKANMSDLASYVFTKGYTLKDLGVDGFVIPSSPILTYNQLIEIFIKNKNIRDHIIHEMINADDYYIYKIYKNIFDALMVIDFNTDFFRDPETNKLPTTYTEYLSKRDSTLYNQLINIHSITDKDSKIQVIANIVNNVTYALSEYIDSEQFKAIYNSFPTMSSEAVKGYIMKIINFFKSYKVDFLGINTIYRFDDKLDNKINIIDCMMSNHIFDKNDIIPFYEIISKSVQIIPSDNASIYERLYIDISRIVNKLYSLNMDIKDKANINCKLSIIDKNKIIDCLRTIVKLNLTTDKKILDKIKKYTSIFDKREDIIIPDSVFLYYSIDEINDILNICKDIIVSIKATIECSDSVNAYDESAVDVSVNYIEKLQIAERVYFEISKIIDRIYKDQEIDINDTSRIKSIYDIKKAFCINEFYELLAKIYFFDKNLISDKYSYIANKNINDYISMTDTGIVLNISRFEFADIIKCATELVSKLYVHCTKNDSIDIYDNEFVCSKLKYNNYLEIDDNVFIFKEE